MALASNQSRLPDFIRPSPPKVAKKVSEFLSHDTAPCEPYTQRPVATTNDHRYEPSSGPARRKRFTEKNVILDAQIVPIQNLDFSQYSYNHKQITFPDEKPGHVSLGNSNNFFSGNYSIVHSDRTDPRSIHDRFIEPNVFSEKKNAKVELQQELYATATALQAAQRKERQQAEAVRCQKERDLAAAYDHGATYPYEKNQWQGNKQYKMKDVRKVEDILSDSQNLPHEWCSPTSKGGGGAPIRTNSGKVKAHLPPEFNQDTTFKVCRLLGFTPPLVNVTWNLWHKDTGVYSHIPCKFMHVHFCLCKTVHVH